MNRNTTYENGHQKSFVLYVNHEYPKKKYY